jgi:hypothetical protein
MLHARTIASLPSVSVTDVVSNLHLITAVPLTVSYLGVSEILDHAWYSTMIVIAVSLFEVMSLQ